MELVFLTCLVLAGGFNTTSTAWEAQVSYTCSYTNVEKCDVGPSTRPTFRAFDLEARKLAGMELPFCSLEWELTQHVLRTGSGDSGSIMAGQCGPSMLGAAAAAAHLPGHVCRVFPRTSLETSLEMARWLFQ